VSGWEAGWKAGSRARSCNSRGSRCVLSSPPIVCVLTDFVAIERTQYANKRGVRYARLSRKSSPDPHLHCHGACRPLSPTIDADRGVDTPRFKRCWQWPCPFPSARCTSASRR
jgi:hypothetical protein